MKTFKVKYSSECPYRLPVEYCNHPDGPIRCNDDNFPDDCPDEDIEKKENG